jgi:hypothetical protein
VPAAELPGSVDAANRVRPARVGGGAGQVSHAARCHRPVAYRDVSVADAVPAGPRGIRCDTSALTAVVMCSGARARHSGRQAGDEGVR